MITNFISSNFCKKRFSASIFFVSSFIEDFFFISFQHKNKKRYALQQSQWFDPPWLHFENFNIFRDLYITQSNIYDGAYITKIVSH